VRQFVPRRRFAVGAILIFMLVPSLACIKARRTPDLPMIFARAKNRSGKTPIIVVPGILGSQIVNSRTREVIWPSTDRSKSDDIDLPITTDLEANRDALVALDILDTTKLSILLPEVKVYSDLLGTLERSAGYRPASLDAPPADGDSDVYYVFYYDWRRDNAENARLLARKIEALKARLGRPELKFNILAHSMGGLIARYYAMYGDRVVENGSDVVPDWAGGANISRLLLLGVPNHGSMDALRSLVEGYNYYGGDVRRSRLFNKLDADLIASLPSVYQLLPHSGTEVYLTGNLTYAPLDLYDTKTWRRNGWGVFDEAHRKRVTKRYGERAEERLRDEEVFLDAVLARAKRFHESLARQSDRPRPFGLFLFGGDCEPTLRAPLIVESGSRRTTVFRGQRVRNGRASIDRDKQVELMFAPGDGRVTRASLLAEEEFRNDHKLFPSALGIDYAVFTCELHGDLPNNSSLQDNVLSILVTDVSQDGQGADE
jgi:pimeloyl-ACP methyl ester carboxylesterase